jgi:hypothetical protein
MKIFLELDTERPIAALLEIREAMGIFSFKLHDAVSAGALSWEAGNHFDNATNELRAIMVAVPEPRHPNG